RLTACRLTGGAFLDVTVADGRLAALGPSGLAAHHGADAVGLAAVGQDVVAAAKGELGPAVVRRPDLGQREAAVGPAIGVESLDRRQSSTDVCVRRLLVCAILEAE